jgi:hypothetical protein
VTEHAAIPEFLARHPGSADKRTTGEQAADALAGGGPRWEDVHGYPYPGLELGAVHAGMPRRQQGERDTAGGER